MPRLVLTALVAACTLVFPAAAHARCAGADTAGLAPAATAGAIACLVNAARADRGLRQLRVSRALNGVVLSRARRILACDVFSHQPCGVGLMRDARRYASRRRRWSVGENLQWRPVVGPTPRSVVERWLASPAHRHNLLAPGWRDHAVGVAQGVTFQGVEHATLMVHWFGRRG